MASGELKCLGGAEMKCSVDSILQWDVLYLITEILPTQQVQPFYAHPWQQLAPSTGFSDSFLSPCCCMDVMLPVKLRMWNDLVCLYTWSRVSDSDVWSVYTLVCLQPCLCRLLCHASPIDWGQTIASQFDDWKYILIIHVWRQTKVRHVIHT